MNKIMQKVISRSDYVDFLHDLSEALKEGATVIPTTLVLDRKLDVHFVVVQYPLDKVYGCATV
jgi:hypothetical protein